MSLLLLFNQRTIYDKTLSDAISLTDNTTITFQASINFQQGISDAVILTDSTGKDVVTELADAISFVDVLIKDGMKHNSDVLSFTDAEVKDFDKTYADVVTLIDEYVKSVSIPQSDSVSFTDIISALFNANYLKELFDAITLSDANTKDVTTLIEDPLTITDDISNEPEVILDDSISVTDAVSTEANKQLADSINLLEEALFLYNANYLKAIFDSFNFSDNIDKKESEVVIEDIITFTDTIKKSPNIIKTDDAFSFVDVSVKTFDKTVFDVVTIAEYLSKTFGVSVADEFAFIDSPDHYHPGPIILETITANGPITIIIEKPSTIIVIEYTTMWVADSAITTNIVFQSKIAL